MKNITEKILESANANAADEAAVMWQWFNNLITNVKLDEKTLTDMFENLTKAEVETWIEEIKECYQGMDEEEEANSMKTASDLAKFYAKHPIEE